MTSMTNWEKILDRKIQMTIKDKSIINGLDLRAIPPFTIVMMNYESLVKFRPPNLDSYDGTKDPINHI